MGARSVRMVFEGRLNAVSFREFAEHRSRRLALRLDIVEIGDRSATMIVVGYEALVDAFEMACSLGPIDCLVRNVLCFSTDDGFTSEGSVRQ
ncbi:MAG: hypothetical protein AAFY56_20110 [Pseudomonadota bacterium]